MEPPATGTARRTPIWLLVTLALLVSLVPAIVAVVWLDGGLETFPDVASLVADFVIPNGAALAVLALVLTVRRLWQPVLTDDRPVRRWVWLVPGLVLATALAATDWGRVVDAGWASLVGLAGVALGAANEELVFRGVFLDELRRWTSSEARAGWLSSILFGLIHLLGGPIQVLISTVFGHVLYVTRRVSGGILVPIVVHTAWNFAVMSALISASPADEAFASVPLTLVSIGMVVVLVVARRRVEPAAA